MIFGNLVCLENLDSRAELDSRTVVGARIVVLVKLVVFEMVGPDVERAHARRFSAEVMTGVLDNQAQVQLTGDVHSKLNLRNVCRLDRELGKAAKSTARIGVSKESDRAQAWREACQSVIDTSARGSDVTTKHREDRTLDR